MSDFAGLWRPGGDAVARDMLTRMGNALDGRDIARARIVAAGAVGLVHRQHHFTFEDLDEAMPLVGRSGAILVADCRLNERADLAAALDVDPRDHADGALILLGFERWGIDVVERLRGCFALAIWDPAAQRLILARDHAGERTLFWHRGPTGIAFATRMRPILGLPEVPDTLDDAALADILILDNGPATRTPYRAIERVPMAHVVIVDADGARSRRYWTPPVPDTLHLRSDAEYDEAAREVIDRSVADALRARGPVALAMTGGLDTVTVAESAVRQSAPRRLLGMTRVPGGALPRDSANHYHDESGLVEQLADMMPGLDWHRVPEDGGDWGEHDERNFFLHGGLPNRAAHNIAWFYPLYRFMAERGSRVMLGGEMGNMFYSAEGTEFLPGMAMRGQWRTVAREIRALARVEGDGWLRTFLRHIVRPVEPLHWRRRRHGETGAPWSWHSALHPDAPASQRLAETLDTGRYRLRSGAGHRDPMVPRDLMMGDEVARDGSSTMRAMNGVDARKPLLDRRVVEFFGALPPNQFLRDGTTRRIARRLIVGRVPDAIALGTRRGRQNGDWFRLLTARRAQLIADVERLQAQGVAGRLVDLDRIHALLQDWPRDADAAELRRTEYLQLLTRGVSMARFLAWHARAN